MLLSDRDIRSELAEGRVVLEPFDEAMVQPSSVDVRLDKFFRVFENHRYPHIDPAEEQPELTREVQPQSGEPFILHPGEFVLASTYEVVTLPDDIAGRLEGKSSLGRLGLLTHSTAGFIDPGFSGHVTLELSNMATLPTMINQDRTEIGLDSAMERMWATALTLILIVLALNLIGRWAARRSSVRR